MSQDSSDKPGMNLGRTNQGGAQERADLRKKLLAWYALNRRDLPWRRSSEPYAIWVSEIMLQQTRVAVVVERYQAFLARFPTLAPLSLAVSGANVHLMKLPTVTLDQLACKRPKPLTGRPAAPVRRRRIQG